MVYQNILETVGRTPLVRINKLVGKDDATLIAKLESFNPCGSVKDRIGLSMIRAAEKDGSLRSGMTIVEPTSGNTGIGVTMVGVQTGYKVVIIMPENMSEERRKIIRAFGGELIFTSAEGSLTEAVGKVKEMQAADSNVWVAEQFENPGNPEVHYLQTATEIWRQLEGKVDAFVAGVGSGGGGGGITSITTAPARQ